MATNFPTSLDVYSDKQDNVDDVLAAHVNNLQDAVEALEAKVGVTTSAVATSLDYLIKNAAALDSGHKHSNTTLTSLAHTKLTYAGLTANQVLIASAATAAAFRAIADGDLTGITVFPRHADNALITGLWTSNPGIKLIVGSAPASPSAGQYHFYAKSDGLYYKSSAGVETGPLLGTAGSFVPLQPAANVTVNGTASDYDFNIKGNVNDYLFHLDAGQNALMINESGATALGSLHAKALGTKVGVYGVSTGDLSAAKFYRNAQAAFASPLVFMHIDDPLDQAITLRIKNDSTLAYGLRVDSQIIGPTDITAFGVTGEGAVHLYANVGLINAPADPNLSVVWSSGPALHFMTAGANDQFDLLIVPQVTTYDNQVPVWNESTTQWERSYPAVLKFDATDEDVRAEMPYGVLIKQRALYADVALSGTAVNAVEIPKGALNCRAIVRQKTTITGTATGLDVGTESDQNVWGDNIPFDVTPPGNLTDSSNYTASPVDIFADNKHVIITARGGTFSGGTLVVILLFEFVEGTTRGTV